MGGDSFQWLVVVFLSRMYFSLPRARSFSRCSEVMVALNIR
jgi:hypothetical protein